MKIFEARLRRVIVPRTPHKLRRPNYYYELREPSLGVFITNLRDTIAEAYEAARWTGLLPFVRYKKEK